MYICGYHESLNDLFIKGVVEIGTSRAVNEALPYDWIEGDSRFEGLRKGCRRLFLSLVVS